jgi:hypothetical protein
MENINNLFDQEITKTLDAYPSIYTKDDVVSLLSKLRTVVLTEVSELKPASSQYDVEAITRGVLDILDGFDFEEFITSEPDLCGSYGSSFTLELNTSFDDYQFAKQIERDVTDYFKDLNKENDEQN